MSEAEDSVCEIIGYEQEVYCEFSDVRVVPSEYKYVDPVSKDWEIVTNEEEATNEEILHYAVKSKSLEFLNDPAEDIYGLDDGEPV